MGMGRSLHAYDTWRQAQLPSQLKDTHIAKTTHHEGDNQTSTTYLPGDRTPKITLKAAHKWTQTLYLPSYTLSERMRLDDQDREWKKHTMRDSTPRKTSKSECFGTTLTSALRAQVPSRWGSISCKQSRRATGKGGIYTPSPSPAPNINGGQ